MGVEFDALGISVPVIPIVVVDEGDRAVDLSRALLAGGLNTIEITLRTDAAIESIRTIKAAVPEMILGAGTVLTPGQMEEAHSAGADFLVSPGATPVLLEAAGRQDIPWLPGATTPSEVLGLLENGYRHQKFFPAEASGGVEKLKAMHAPIPGVSFCPTGGITPENAAGYLSLPNVLFVGGTWIATRQMIRERQWGQIEEQARQAAILKRK